MGTLNIWHPVKDVLEIIESDGWTWLRNTNCKYINLRIDTRDNICVVENRAGEIITLKQLARQHEKAQS